MKTEADSNDVTECLHDDKWPTVGMFCLSDAVICLSVCYTLQSQTSVPNVVDCI